MQRFRKPGIILLIILLAVLCIGGVELAVCSVKEPALYEQLTAPVRQAAQTAVENGQYAWNRVCAAAQAVGDEVEKFAAQTQQAIHAWTAEPESESESPEDEEVFFAYEHEA